MKNRLLNSRLCKISLLICSIFLCLLIIEVFLDKIVFVPKVEGIDLHSFGASYVLSDNRDLIYIPKSNVEKNNSYGHRGKDFPFEKGKKERIIFLGDSVVEGYGIDVKKRFTEILDKLQSEKYEIINLGVRGYNFKQEVEYLKEMGMRFNPDYIFFGITYNDLVLHSGEIYSLDEKFKHMEHSAFYTNYFKTKSSLEKLMLKTNIYRLIKYRSCGTEDEFQNKITYRISSDEQSDILDNLVILSEQFRIKICFVFLPVNTDYEKIQLLHFRRLIKSAGFIVIDLENIISEENRYEKDFFLDDDSCHLNSTGHEIVAQIINEKTACFD